MSARDDYPYNGGNVHEYEKQTDAMCVEIDWLRGLLAEWHYDGCAIATNSEAECTCEEANR